MVVHHYKITVTASVRQEVDKNKHIHMNSSLQALYGRLQCSGHLPRLIFNRYQFQTFAGTPISLTDVFIIYLKSLHSHLWGGT